MAGKSATPLKTASLDLPLHVVGFNYDLLSPEKLTGHLTVTESCCQPYKLLHGGVSAMIAEGMASMGAYIASGFGRVAGVQLSTNHFRAANFGELVQAEAVPILKGRTIQVWEVQLWKIEPSSASGDKLVLLSSSRVTLRSNLPSSEDMKNFEDTVKNAQCEPKPRGSAAIRKKVLNGCNTLLHVRMNPETEEKELNS